MTKCVVWTDCFRMCLSPLQSLLMQMLSQDLAQLVWLFLAIFPHVYRFIQCNKNTLPQMIRKEKNWNLDNLRRPPTSRIAREKRNEIGKNACKRRSIFYRQKVGWELGRDSKYLRKQTNKQTNIARVRVSVGRAPKGNSSSRCFRCYVSFNLFSTAWVPSVFFSQLLDLVGCHQCWRQVILIFLICQAWMWR